MRICYIIAGILLLCPRLEAQNHSLDTLLITADRQATYGLGGDLQKLDSADIQAFSSGSLADLLYQQKGLMVQQYGPGQLASPSIRGTSAAHTAVIWEGFQLQSSMNGQVDLSLFPAGFSDQVSWVPGANAALWGAGAMGGTILLEQGKPRHKGWQAQLNAQAGSFGFDHQSGALTYGNDHVQSATRLFHRQSDNDFHYFSPGRVEPLRRENAAFQQMGLMQSFHIRLGERQQLESHTWWQNSERQIPRSAQQNDQHLRQALRWQYLGDHTLWTIRSAWMNESLNYNDSIAALFSDNLTRNWISEAEGNWQWGMQKLKIGLHLSQFKSFSANYAASELREYRPAIFAAWRWDRARWRLSTQLRQGWTGNQPDPIVPSLGLEWQARSFLQFRFRLNRNYRVPTFNDRFWQPGGNPELLPELGWSTELGGDYRWKRTSFHLTVYSSFIDNWIQWVPETHYWRPQNVRNVWNRGLETRLQQQWSLWGWDGMLKLNHQFTYISSYQSEPGQGFQTGLQHLFVPIHQGGLSLYASQGAWSLQSGHTFTGKRFTATDHSSWLPAHGLAYARLAFACKQPRFHHWQVSARVDNLWNIDFQLLPGRPMPLRSYLIGLSYNWKSTVEHEKNL